MKKVFVFLSIVLTLVIGTAVVYADNDLSPMNFSWRYKNNLSGESVEEMLENRDEFRRNEIEKALENGTITESEAKEWEDHFNYMDEFHSKNRYMDGGRGLGRGCRRMMRGNRF